MAQWDGNFTRYTGKCNPLSVIVAYSSGPLHYVLPYTVADIIQFQLTLKIPEILETCNLSRITSKVTRKRTITAITYGPLASINHFKVRGLSRTGLHLSKSTFVRRSRLNLSRKFSEQTLLLEFKLQLIHVIY